MRKASKKGFTIIELVVVIAVIAILAAVLIPTFASLINKANESVDMQLVKQMNTVLTAEELTEKPNTVVAARGVLTENGITQYKPVDDACVFYWISTENRIVLWDNEDSKVLYPKEYKDAEKLETTWFDLNYGEDDVQVVPNITPGEGQTIVSALTEAINNASSTVDVYLTLPKNASMNMTDAEFKQFGAALTDSQGQGKNVHIDLNGGHITVDSQAYLTISKHGTLELSNGSFTVNGTNTYSVGQQLFTLMDGASVVLRDMKVFGTAFCAIAAPAESNEVIIDKTEMTVNTYYVISTNGLTSDNLKVIVRDSKLQNNFGLGILVNTTSAVYIDNSTLSGQEHALVMRAGSVEVKNSVLETVADEAGVFEWNNFNSDDDDRYQRPTTGSAFAYETESIKIVDWRQGNAVPGAALVLGDYAKESSSYVGDVNCTLENVTFKAANVTELPNILVAAKQTKNVSLTYDASVTDVTYYGMVAEWFGSITINGVAKNYDGTDKAN